MIFVNIIKLIFEQAKGWGQLKDISGNYKIIEIKLSLWIRELLRKDME